MRDGRSTSETDTGRAGCFWVGSAQRVTSGGSGGGMVSGRFAFGGCSLFRAAAGTGGGVERRFGALGVAVFVGTDACA